MGPGSVGAPMPAAGGHGPLVSVITPVYNGERYLEECIESVLAQTYANWEFVIVNNRSTDGTLAIAERYARRDGRIRIHTNAQFVGSLQNQNTAFRQMSAAATYCKVLHADDWLFPECLERMVAMAEANPAVGIVGAYSLEGLSVKCTGIPYRTDVMPGRELCRLTLLGKLYVFLSPTSLLIRADLVRGRDPFYNESYLHADTEACFEILQRHDFGFVHQILTYIRVHEGSISSNVAWRFNTFLVAWLDILRQYGRSYFAAEDYEQVWRQRYDEYYRFLGKSVLQLRGKEFWDYHRRELQRIGCPLDQGRLLSAAVGEAVDPFLHPIRVFKHTLNTVRRRRGASKATGHPRPAQGPAANTR
jgi:glycosyltransferase involved in cell wall biosynthesis